MIFVPHLLRCRCQPGKEHGQGQEYTREEGNDRRIREAEQAKVYSNDHCDWSEETCDEASSARDLGVGIQPSMHANKAESVPDQEGKDDFGDVDYLSEEGERPNPKLKDRREYCHADDIAREEPKQGTFCDLTERDAALVRHKSRW